MELQSGVPTLRTAGHYSGSTTTPVEAVEVENMGADKGTMKKAARILSKSQDI